MPSREKLRFAERTKYKNSLLKLMQQESLMENSLFNLLKNMALKSEVVQLVLHDMTDTSRKR